jgi:hypothetical protein
MQGVQGVGISPLIPHNSAAFGQEFLMRRTSIPDRRLLLPKASPDQ